MSSPRTPVLLRAALLGVATGGRSLIGVAALAVTHPTGPRSGGRWPDRRLTTPAVVLASAAELVGDKLPMTPSRLAPAGFIPRLALGGLGAAILARREGHSSPFAVAAAVLGVAGAVLGARGGAAGRRLATARLGRDLPGALVEDATVVLAATVATRGRVWR